MRTRWIIALCITAASLSACGRTTEMRKVAPVVSASAPAPIPTVDGIPQPQLDCVEFSTIARVGWKVYGWDNMEQRTDILDWSADTQAYIDRMSDSPLGFSPTWYCPPQ